jgi:hypothetical protein
MQQFSNTTLNNLSTSKQAPILMNEQINDTVICPYTNVKFIYF